MESSSKYFKKIIRIIGTALVLVILVSGLFAYQYYKDSKLPVDIDNQEDMIIDIPNGSSTSKIAGILKENSLIRSELYFRFIAKQKKVDASFQAGKYKLNKSMAPEEIIEKIVEGEAFVDTVKFTIPEGFELVQIVDRISNLEGINVDREKLMDLIANEDFDFEFLKDIPKGENRLEGFLFPDTYQVKKDITEKEILLIMLNRFNQVFKEEYYQRTKELDMSINEIITLASIIEREAQASNERAIISGVFYNRLDKRMLLQSCATVQYILGERKEVLSLKDIAIDSPYNTYKYVGLPPKPIASPGQASIEAALFPEDNNYLYFVAKGDGSHVFSETYSDHLKAKAKYQ